jgi:hypothetical protein
MLGMATAAPDVTAHPGHCYRLADGSYVIVRWAAPSGDSVTIRDNGDLARTTTRTLTAAEWAALSPRLAS